jgi:GrpB-like predicted nucleotidyltransferase (UPF0157 family)/RimJ/RimL family protein N-acetyltransferase
MRSVQVVDYDPEWPWLFQEETKHLRKIFKKNIIWLEHIGSTAVPGLCAKPIIDILIGVRNIKLIDRYQQKMKSMKYIPKGEFGIVNRRFFIKGSEENRTHHIHIFQMGNTEIARHVNFKYYLLDHPKVREQYGEIKRSLSEQFVYDIDQYIKHKNDFIQSVEKKAVDPSYLSKQVLETERLKLRPLKPSDTEQVYHLWRDKSISERMIQIPYPCEKSDVARWVRRRRVYSRKGEEASFAIVLKKQNLLIGSITLWINERHRRAEFSYWIGKFYRNHGYCTEAARKLLYFGFIRLGLNRIYAQHFASNPASGKVMQKLGMQYEGYFREHFKKKDHFKDSKQYAVLATDRWNEL